MPEFRVIKGGADSKPRRKSVAGSKRVTEEQKKAANAVWSPDASASGSAFAPDDLPLTPGFDAASGTGLAGEGEPADKASSTNAASTHRRRAVSTKSPAAKALTAFVIAAFALLVVLLCAFAGYRWLYGNDGQDIQGSWYVNGSAATMSFTETEIILNEDVSYDYALNGADKTIAFSFSDMTGSGSYRFSLDRNTLAIIDGEASAIDTLTADFTWFLGAIVCVMKGEEPSPVLADTENVTLLTRVPEAPAVEGDVPADAGAEGTEGAEGVEGESTDSGAQDDAAVSAEGEADSAGDQATQGAEDDAVSDGAAGEGTQDGSADAGSADVGASSDAGGSGESAGESSGSGSDLSFGGAVSDHV